MPDYVTITVKIGGQALAAATLADLVEVVVDTALSLPGSFTLEFTNHKAAHDSEFTAGNEVVISAGDPDEGDTQLISGIITAIEPIYVMGDQILRVRGYDKSIKLSQGKKTRTFLQQTDSDMFSSIVSADGLSAATDSTSTTYPHVIQYNQTDWDFIRERATPLGFVLSMDGSTLNIKKPASSSPIATLNWGADLSRFEPRASFLGQLVKATSTGWDVKNKQAISGTASSSSADPYRSILTSGGSSAVSSNVSSSVSSTVIDLSLVDSSQATNSAQALLNRAESGYVTAEGECIGNPLLKAGCIIAISDDEGDIATKYIGNYMLTQAHHEIRRGYYITTFSACGAEPETILSLLASERQAGSRVDGVVIGQVTQTQDPDNGAKVKVKYPWLKDINGTEVESGWMRLATSGAGKDRGIGFIPEINDEVLVAFADGNINAPFVVGALWNGVDTPPTGMLDGNGKVVQRVVRSRSGHLIVLDDTDGSENITIKDKTGNNSITISSKDNSVLIQSDGDLTLQAKGKLILKSTQDASLESSSGKTEVKASTELALTANQKASMSTPSGSKVDLESSGTKLEGLMVDITGQTKASLKGSAMVEVSGALVKIN